VGGDSPGGMGGGRDNLGERHNKINFEVGGLGGGGGGGCLP